MEPLPLKPKPQITTNHETSHVMRDAFQELLCEPTYPFNVAENTDKYNVKMEALKISGITTTSLFENTKMLSEHVSNVEQELMKSKGEYLLAKDLISRDTPLREKIKLSRFGIFRNILSTNVTQYGLLQSDGLLPNIPERSIDFRLNSNRHLCKQPCKSDSNGLALKFLEHEKTINNTINNTINKNINILIKRNFKDVNVFEAMPTKIIFYNYELNVSYKKTLKIKNITKSTRSISLKVLPKSKYFTIYLKSGSRIAPGMCAIYTIYYKTKIYHDVLDTIVFNTYTGSDVKVRLISQRNSPSLRTFVFKTNHIITKTIKLNSTSSESFDIDRTIALNSTIDCGCALIGDELKLTLIMKNEGGYGRFFFMTENDWFDFKVQDINSRMDLITEVFQLYPVYFVVDENEFVEIEISFCPRKYGLYIETLYLLCSNNTLEEIDVIGDGVIFDKAFVTFDMTPKESKPFFLDLDAEYCLHLGTCLSCSKHTGYIIVNNNSSLNLQYRWDVRKSQNMDDDKFNHIQPHWLTIKRIRCLPSYSTTEIEIILCPEVKEGGLYRTVLCLYIENVPEASLQDDVSFVTLQRPDYSTSMALDILVGEIEIVCQIEEINILIEPNPLVIPYLISCNEEYNQTISIVSCSNLPLNCAWAPHKTNSTTNITPEEFKLNDAEKFVCNVKIFSTEVRDIEEQYLLHVNGDTYKEYFKVLGRMERPRACFSDATINFENVMIGFGYTKELFVINNSQEAVTWHIEEHVLDLATSEVMKVDTYENLNPRKGSLQEGEKCLIEYIANTDKCGEWLSYLKLYTNFSQSDQPDSSCAIHYKVCKPQILVHSNTSELPIIAPKELLFVEVTSDNQICLHNSGNIDTVFIWGKPTGNSCNDFEIDLVPKVGIIRMQENVHIDVHITPLKMGYFEEIYLPCFTLGCQRTILVKLMCLVGDITVNIFLPNSLGNYYTILWPPKFLRDICYEDFATESAPVFTGQEEYMDRYHEESYIETEFGEEEMSVELLDFEESDKLHNTDNTNIEVIFKQKNFITDEIVSRTGTLSVTSVNYKADKSSETSCILFASSDQSSISSDETFPSRQKLKEFFGSDLVVQDYILEYQNVPLRTPVKKTITIENLTPGWGSVNSEVTNFYHVEEEESTVTDILVKMKVIKSNKWEDITTNEGIVVKIDQSIKKLDPFKSVELDVWVYANTWGYYVDELVIDISELLPFCATVVIEVVGLPIEFPIAQNSIRKEATLRLGVMSYKAESIIRKVKITNTSMVPISVNWHLFIKTDHEKDFNVLFEFNDCESNSNYSGNTNGEVILTKEYYGEPNSTLFEVYPNMSCVEAQKHEYIEIITHVSRFDENYFNKKLEVNLIGIIQTPTEYKFQPNLYKRRTGVDIDVLKFKINGEIDIPRVDISHIPDRVEVTSYATHIMEDIKFTHRKRLIFKNARYSQAVIYMEIEPPFEFVSVKSINTNTSKFETPIVVNPEECLEVVIQCELYAHDILKKLESLKRASINLADGYPNYTTNSIVISRPLTIYQRGFVQKMVSFDLIVFYPKFQAIPKTIEFGTVFVGNTAKNIVQLKNLTAAPISFRTFKSNKSKEVVIQPTSGIIPKVSEGGDFMLCIFFTPSESKTYQESIVVASSLPHHFLTVHVIGAGTYNESFYVAGIH